ncbi:MAG TPA: EF-hand domain-containing protein [Candidatus Saccharibacteria bacterium]|nr:EF-hand domain-containing protein [Candidatus Saccharibacteria bacterium]
MSLLDDLKAKADVNGDGKLSAEDLASLKDKISPEQFDQLKQLADRNDDGSINFDDVKSLDLGGIVDDIKGAVGGLFGK